MIDHSTRKQLFHWSLRVFLAINLAFAAQWFAIPPREVKAATTLYVTTTGSDTGNCVSAPCRTIQFAVGKTASGDTILVAGGVYSYNLSVDPCSFLVTRAVVCLVDKDLAILGGYDGVNWSVLDPVNHPTLIDGGTTYRGVAIIAYASTASLRMEGFTIQNCLAQGVQSTNPFINSGFGGGMWAQNSSVTLRNVIFKSNRSRGANLHSGAGGSGSGGGLAIQSTKNRATSTLEYVTFDGNEADGGSGPDRGGVAIGGALFTYDMVLVGTNLTLTNNKALAGSSSGVGSDGGLHADALGGAGGFQYNSDITLTGVTATGNQAIGGNAGSNGTGGGGFGGALSVEQSTFRLNVARIQGNQALGGVANTGGIVMGGGLMSDASPTTIDRTWVIANTARSGGSSTSNQAGSANGGGGDFAYWATSGIRTTTITNSIFADNKIEVGTPGSVVGGGGGGAMFQAVQAIVTHSTFAQNTFGEGLKVGQAIVVWGNGGDGTSGVLGSLTLRYSIISDHIEPAGTTNSSAVTVLANNSASLSYVLFANNTRDTNSTGLPMPPGAITLSNSITASSVGYVSPGSPNYDYHLTGNSSAIGQAVGSTTPVDIDGDSRPAGAASDVGTDEYQVLPQPNLGATPPVVEVLTDQKATILITCKIGVSFGPQVNWSAVSGAIWLYLGASGSNLTLTGVTGAQVIFQIRPPTSLGTYNTTVQFTSPSANPVSVPVRLVKVQTLYKAFIPKVQR